LSDPDDQPRVDADSSRYHRVAHAFGRDDPLPIDPDLAPDDPSTPRPTHTPATHGIHRRDPVVLVSIAVGGFIGTTARYEVGRAFPVPLGGFPWATFAINTSGAFLLGLLITLFLERWRVDRWVRPFMCTGLLGAWTTMSTFALESDVLAKDGHGVVAVAYPLTTLFAGLAATAFGIAVGRPRGARP